MTRWTRHAREHLVHELLFGWPVSAADGWYPRRGYPEPGSKRERVARIALANALRKGDAFSIGAVAAPIDPRTDSAIAAQQIEFTSAKDKRHEPKTSLRRNIEIAEFLHDWRGKHPSESIEEAVAAAVDRFGFENRMIWNVWKQFGRKRKSEK
jgi:hypothetical protein